MPRSRDRATPVGREQRPRSIPQTKSPEPGQETGPSVVRTTVFDRMPARFASDSGVIGIWLDGRLRSVDGFALETQHHGSSGRKVELTRFESLSVYHSCIQDRSRSSCRDGEGHAYHRLHGQLVAAQEHMLLAPVGAQGRQLAKCCWGATSSRSPPPHPCWSRTPPRLCGAPRRAVAIPHRSSGWTNHGWTSISSLCESD